VTPMATDEHGITRQGVWIAFEGLDGCGKSTQADLLAEAIDAKLVFEPGGTALGRSLRNLLLHGDDPGERAEALLFAADRANLVATVVTPTTNAGRHVVSDRSLWSSVAYQGYGRGLGATEIFELNRWALEGRLPDLVVYLSIDPKTVTERVGNKPDRLEQEALAFHQQVARGFTELASTHGWLTVDGQQPRDRVARQILHGIRERLVI
jgi:dTMP kinase